MANESEPTGTRKTQRTEFSRRDPQIAGLLVGSVTEPR
jgi:hypothetical protein